MATNKTIKKKVPQVSWQQAMQQANKQDDYLRTLGLDPSVLSPAQRAQALLNYDLTPAVAKEVKNASATNVSKTNKKQTIPYKEVNSASADVFRDVVLPLVANPLPFVTGVGVPSNISQMAAKTILGDARMSNSSLTDNQKVILWNVIQNARKRSGVHSGGGTEYQDYGNLGYGSSDDFNNWFNRGKVNVLSGLYNSYTNPGFELASTIGRGRYWQDPENENTVYYTDVYDWNPSEKNFAGNNAYQVVRNAVREGENKNMTTVTNDPYRMNFKLTKEEIDNILAKKKEDEDSFLGFFKDGGWLNKYQNGGYYEVKKGDNLWGISQSLGVSLNKLLAANPQLKDPDLIQVGQKLVLPGITKQSYSPVNKESVVYNNGTDMQVSDFFNPASFKGKNVVKISPKDNKVEAYIPPRPQTFVPSSESNQGTSLRTQVSLQNEVIAQNEKEENKLMNQYGYNRQQAREVIERSKKSSPVEKLDYVVSDPRSQSYVGNPSTSLLWNPNQVQGQGARALEAGMSLPIDIAALAAVSEVPAINTALLAASIPSAYEGVTKGVPTSYRAWKKYIEGPGSDWTEPVYETSKTILDIAPTVDLYSKLHPHIPNLSQLEDKYVRAATLSENPKYWDMYSSYREFKRNPLGMFTKDVNAPTVDFLQRQRELAKSFDPQKRKIMEDIRVMTKSSIDFKMKGSSIEEKLKSLKDIEKRMHEYSEETVFQATGLNKQDIAKKINSIEKKLNLGISKIDFADDPSKIINFDQYEVPYTQNVKGKNIVYGQNDIAPNDFLNENEVNFYKTVNENRQEVPFISNGSNRENSNPLTEIKKFKEKIAAAPSNSEFLAATSMSADSKPIELRGLIDELRSGTVKKIKFHGMGKLNDMSNLYDANLPKPIIVDHLNNLIEQINLYLPKAKKLKGAVLLSDGEIYIPQITLIKK